MKRVNAERLARPLRVIRWSFLQPRKSIGPGLRPSPVVILEPAGRAFVQGRAQDVLDQAKRMSGDSINAVASGASVYLVCAAAHATGV